MMHCDDAIKICKKHGELVIAQTYISHAKSRLCKICRKEYKKRLYEKNKEKIGEKTKKWRIDNPEKFQEMSRKYYLKNQEERKKYTRDWIEKNREKKKIADQRYYKANKEKIYLYRSKKSTDYRRSLSDGYVRAIISKRGSLLAKDIPVKLLEIKRVHLKLQRKLREIENANKDNR